MFALSLSLSLSLSLFCSFPFFLSLSYEVDRAFLRDGNEIDKFPITPPERSRQTHGARFRVVLGRNSSKLPLPSVSNSTQRGHENPTENSHSTLFFLTAPRRWESPSVRPGAFHGKTLSKFCPNRHQSRRFGAHANGTEWNE